jgi:(E)-4-hydroxy-3-methylbut-2-enyl-diphosphate synthase
MPIVRLTNVLPGYNRRRTRVVPVGDVGVGGDHPIRVQSMTTTTTADAVATAAQATRLAEAGCEIVRVTVPTTADAEALPEIRRLLAARGVRVPLVADIHFTPAVAMKAVEHVDKVRVNPGNFADKKKFAVREYTDAEYDAEIARIEKVFSPLVKRAKELGVSMRIGTNHGSLSDRILNRYGDTPLGMVESALEFVRICESHGYRDLILSMKASNPRVVLEAYRLLAARMDEAGMDYPLHLGVTEAGDGEDGRIKSAVGIGALLEEGLGDTVRVSLTEDPVAEIPVAYALVAPFNANLALAGTPSGSFRYVSLGLLDPPVRRERGGSAVAIGPRTIGEGGVLVEVPLHSPLGDPDAVRRELDGEAGVRVPEDTRAEVVSVRVAEAGEIGGLAALRGSMELVAPKVSLSGRAGDWIWSEATSADLDRLFDAAHRVHVRFASPSEPDVLARLDELLARSATGRAALLVELASPRESFADIVAAAREVARRAASCRARWMLAVDPLCDVGPLLAVRRVVRELDAIGAAIPIVLLDRPRARGVDPLLGPAANLGGLLCEGIGDSVQVEAESAADSRRLAFNVLQATRIRMTKTDFISCPSCGRTLFDLETTTAAIKEKTGHLKGLKIAVMGCIVNGPGEMADADFGYVGWGDDKIALFVGKEMVAKDVPTADAADRLVELIKSHGRWVDPTMPDSSCPAST